MSLLDHIPAGSLVGLDTVIDTAAALRAKYRLRMLDAIHVACAMVNRADRFLTNDVDLRKVNEIPILILSDFLPVAP